MWTLPKSLISAFAPGMEVLTSDSVECSRICAQSLIRRSKPSLAKTYLREWKVGNWTRLRSGVISKHSLGNAFEEWWIFSLGAIPASHSQAQANDLEQKTSDIFGPTSQAEFVFSSPESAFSRTLKDTSRWDSPQSSAIWKRWVTTCRSEYSQRLKQARLTSASECLSVPWPTPSQRDYKGACASRVTPEGYNSRLDEAVIVFGPAAPANFSTAGSRPESWLTPRANEPTGDSNFVTQNADRGEHCHPSLTSQAKSWSTPTVTDASAMSPEMRPSRVATGRTTEYLARQIQWATPRAEHDSGGHRGTKDTLHSQIKTWATPHANCHNGAGQAPEKQGAPNLQTQTAGKLNPRWVETLMGLPVGWTMPSCSLPIANPASAAENSNTHNAETTTQTALALAQIATMTDNRTDELRLLGNGVVPATAALAFKTLIHQL